MEKENLEMKVIKGNKSIIFPSFDGNYFLYENICNTLQNGKLKELKDLQRKIETEPFSLYFGIRNLNKPQKFDQLLLNTTEECNLRCDYCIFGGNYYGERTHSDRSMSLDKGIKALEIFCENCVEDPYLGFYGGEPLLNFNLIKNVVEKANSSQKNFKFSLTTNFTVVDDETLKFLINNNFNIFISLDGPKEIHDSSRRYPSGRGTYEKIMSNIDRLNYFDKEFVKRNVAFNVTYRRTSNLTEIISFFKENFPYNFVVANPVQQKLSKKFFEVKDDFAGVIQIMLEYANNIIEGNENDFVSKSLFDMEVWKIFNREKTQAPKIVWPGGSCIPGFRKLFVSCDGDFYICEKFGEIFPLGNTKQGFDKKASYRLLKRFINIKNDLCRDCWAGRLCSSCIVSAKDGKGISSEGLAESCEIHQGSSLTGLLIYSYLLEKDKNKNFVKYYQNIQV